MNDSRRVLLPALFIAIAWAGAIGPPPAGAASYLPLSDADLARRSPVIVLAEPLEERTRLDESETPPRPYTEVRLRALEILKGSLPEESFRVRIPGGWAEDVVWFVPGTPRFTSGQQGVLFLHPLEEPGEYGLSEFGLSKFDVLEDAGGVLYAVRSVFSTEEDQRLSALRTPLSPRAVRQLDPFLESLRAAGRAGAMAPARYGEPVGALRTPRRGIAPAWVNLAGREPGSCGTLIPCLVRWFWDTVASPNAVVSITGTQTNLTDASNGSAHVGNAVMKWSGVAGTDVRYSGPAASGNVEVRLDLEMQPGGSWSTPLPCGGGVLGTGTASFIVSQIAYRGDQYYRVVQGLVEMRKSTCASGYSSAVFRSGVLHEVGHTLGLGHPDQAQSTHSTTNASDWNAAVMRSAIPSSFPDTPQTDDVQATQYYYPRAGSAVCVPGPTTLCLNNARFQVQALWSTQQSSGAAMAVSLTGETGYLWFFDSGNVEAVVKLLNGCGVNQRYWVFAAGLTDVGVALTVTDTQNGTVKTYQNPRGTAFAPIQDTSAFATCP